MLAHINEQVPMYVTLRVGGTNIKFIDWAGNQNRHDLANVGPIFSLNSLNGSSAISMIDIPTKKTNNRTGVTVNWSSSSFLTIVF
jgi:hypothetical protein